MIDTYRLSNTGSLHSGVQGAVLWFSCGEFDDENSELGPRIRVVPDGQKRAAEITLEVSPRVLGDLPQEIRDDAVKWVIVNRGALLRHWNDESDTVQCFRELVRVDGAQPVKLV